MTKYSHQSLNLDLDYKLESFDLKNANLCLFGLFLNNELSINNRKIAIFEGVVGLF